MWWVFMCWSRFRLWEGKGKWSAILRKHLIAKWIFYLVIKLIDSHSEINNNSDDKET